MLLSLLVALSSTPLPAVALRSDDPPVRVWLDPDAYVTTGDRMHVHLRAAADGYVIVLRADAQGRVRVLFPLDPTDDAFVRGGKTVEVKSRGDREAFSVDDASGTGTVHAEDRKSTRLNSSHATISYAVFCLKKKNRKKMATIG